VEVEGCVTNNANNGNSTFISLPQVIDFQVVKENQSSRILWNNNFNDRTNHFIIEKSIDGEHFYAFLNVDNNSTAAGFIFYDKKDDSPVFGENYYRLRLIQKDGSEILSTTQMVRFATDWNQVFVFPNPAKNEIRINLESHIGRKVDLQIIDGRGGVVEERHFEKLETAQPVFDLNKYENGLYIMTVQIDGFKTISRKFIVEKGF